MAKIMNYVVPVDEVVDRIYETKLERGGYIEVVIPVIGMADKITYRCSDEYGINVVVEKDNTAVIQKYMGRKITIRGTFEDDKNLYRMEKFTYTVGDKKGTTTHKLTFYWRQVKKAAKK